MSNRSEKERERLKEEYKDHYRKIRDIKEKVRRSQSVKNISDTVENMNTDELMASVDHFLDKVRDKVAHFEARLDVAMENLTGEDRTVSREEMDETVRKERARETLKQVKIEMGLLYNEIEKRADDIKVQKTVGSNQQEPSSDSPGKLSKKTRTEEP
jgi:phage shock protein A